MVGTRDCWWRGNFERHSYFLAEWQDNKVRLTLIGRDADQPEDVGLGEAYRAITHYGGWASYQQAGTAMALAAFANADRKIEIDIIRCLPDGISVAMQNRHPEPVKMVRDLLKPFGIECWVPPGRTATPRNVEFCNVIALMQSQLEDAIVKRIMGFAAQYGIKAIAMSGGVSLNCLAMGKLASAFDGEVYVTPAPGDTGQGLGNAFWAAYCEDSPVSGEISRDLSHPSPPFWGIPIPKLEIDLVAQYARKDQRLIVVEHESAEDQAKAAAGAIAAGKVVATALGCSEFGPRALGARSILADPRAADTPQKVNRFKRRESFRPFAPAVLAEHATTYFCSTAESRFMSFAAPAEGSMKASIPAVVHADGTARFQTVCNGPMRTILEAFFLLTGIPVLLNTSFNRKGQPIIETPMAAFEIFQDSSLDMLLLDNLTIIKKEFML